MDLVVVVVKSVLMSLQGVATTNLLLNKRVATLHHYWSVKRYAVTAS